MSYEKLYNKLCEYAINDNSPLADDVKVVLKEFFKANVCIPKGENRHPYADVLHQWAEDTSKRIEQSNNGKFMWFGTPLPIECNELRIKPSEPIYVWRWIDIENEDEAQYVNGGEFMTEEEAKKYTSFGKIKKITGTMQERK